MQSEYKELIPDKEWESVCGNYLIKRVNWHTPEENKGFDAYFCAADGTQKFLGWALDRKEIEDLIEEDREIRFDRGASF